MITPPYLAPAIGRAIRCPEDAKNVYHRWFPGATPASDWRPQPWAARLRMDALFLSRCAELASRLVDLSATERPGDLVDEWAQTYQQVQRLAAELSRATEHRTD